MRASSAPSHNTALADAIRREIASAPRRTITFARFMEMALYEPGLGYYVSGENRTGKDGDFFTSVSVGECFGMLLARHASEVPGSTVVEQGANDARLAIDILRHSPGDTRYVIVEPSPTLRSVQESNLAEAGFADRARTVARLADLDPVDGIFLANELVDAFPVHRVRFDGGCWREIHVACEGDSFAETDMPIESEDLRAAVAEIGDVSAGYTTEISLAADRWIAEAAGVLRSGVLSIVDYGHESDAYYAPSRTSGTLRCYRRHQADEDPYAAIGETDITAHVNFTRLRRAGEAAGLRFLGLTDQHRFCVRQGAPWLREIEGKTDADTAKLVRQFQTLAHPSIMGTGFRVISFGRNLAPACRLSAHQCGR